MIENKIGILITNIGTPDLPTTAAVRRYLKQFLSDKRVVEIPKAVWLPILYGVILPFRSKKSAKLYQKIWTNQGSPLLYNSKLLTQKLIHSLNLPIELGMHYGEPSIPHALNALQQRNVNKILVVPLFPQYSATTSAGTFDLVARTLQKWRVVPEIRTIMDYADHPLYIKALAESILNSKVPIEDGHLLFSFHGIPKKYTSLGDPYQSRCEKTVALLTRRLGIKRSSFSLTFQSRLGRAEWLQPYTDQTFQSLPQSGVKKIQVICPGFSVDCLETLEEISIRGKEQFLRNGGQNFHYIPALNDDKNQVELLSDLIAKNINNW